MNSRYLNFGSLLSIVIADACLATPMIGNLDQFPSHGVGDVRTPGPGIYFGTGFTTDSKAYYTLDAVTLEQYMPGQGTLQVRLFRVDQTVAGETMIPVAELGSPVVLSDPTPYPALTRFVSYSPSEEVLLEPSKTYIVAVTQAEGGVTSASVLFASSPGYRAAEGWSLDGDYTGIVTSGGILWGTAPPGHLKFQVDATFNKYANLPPDVSQAQASVTTLWPPNGKLVPFQVVGVTDPNGDPVTITVTDIVQDEPVDEVKPKGKAGYDALLLWDSLAMVRAERLGNGNGRVYSVVFLAADDKGGVSEGVVFITVPHDSRAAAVDDGPATGYYLSMPER